MRSRSLRRTLLLAVVVVIGLPVVLFFALPHAAGVLARRALDRHPTYDGRFDSLDMDLLKGRMTIEDLVLTKKGEAEGEPFVTAASASARVHWRPLLKRQVIGEMLVVEPRVHVVAHAVEKEKEEAKKEMRQKNVVRAIQDLMPFRVDRFEIRDGAATYVNNAATPTIRVGIDAIHLVAENLTNRARLSDRMPARAEFRARIMKSGGLGAKMQFDPFAPSPLFDIDFRLKDLELRSLNAFVRHYAGMDVARGTLSLAAEAAVDGSRYKGYLKPTLLDFEMRSKNERDDGPVKAVKEWAVETIEKIFENPTTERAGSRVPFSGRLADSSVDVWTAAIELFRNAFVEALSPHVEGEFKLGEP